MRSVLWLCAAALLCVSAGRVVPAMADGGGPESAKLRLEALRRARAGDTRGAISLYRRAIAAQPKSGAAYEELGRLLFSMRRFSEAAKQFQASLRHRANHDRTRYNLAYALRKAGRHAEARDAYRAYLRKKSDDPDAHFGLATTLKALGDKAGAAREFRRYTRLEKRPSEAKWVARALTEARALEAARPVSPTAHQALGVGGAPPEPAPAKPKNSNAVASSPPGGAAPATGAPAGTIARRIGVAAQALALPPAKRVSARPAPPRGGQGPAAAPIAAPAPARASHLAPAAPVSSAPSAPAGPAPTATGALKPPTANETRGSRQVVLGDGNGTDGKALLRRGETLFRIRRYRKAREVLEKAAEAGGKDPELYYKLAAARAATGDLKAALTAWEKVIALDPGNRRARELALMAQERLGILKKKGRLPTGEPASVARAALAAGRAAQALQAFDRALDTKEPPVELLLGKGRALMNLGRYRRAADALIRAAALRPAEPLPYYLLGTVYRRLGNRPQAVYYYELFLSLAKPADRERSDGARRWLAGIRAKREASGRRP